MKIRALHLFAAIAITPSLAAQSNPIVPQDSATFDADGTAHITRVIPMPTTISPEAQKWLQSLSEQKVGLPETLAERRTHTDAWRKKDSAEARKLYPVNVAVEVLEAAGYRVTIPRANLCCGRPLYDFGMLDRAERLLLDILDQLEPEIEAGIPVIGLEPSCVAVFRDELLNLFPHDQRAQALSKQTFLLSEFLDRNSANAPLPQLNRKALLHGHCHHKSIMKMTAEESLLTRIGIDFQSPAPGAAAWPDLSASNGIKTSTTSRRPSANSNSSPPSAALPPTGSSSPTASAAASRSRKAPTATPCIWPKSSRWH